MYNRIALISDLHLDSWAFHDADVRLDLMMNLLLRCYDKNVDLVLLAGDVFNGSHEKQFMLVDKKPAVLVAVGNHDLYGHALPERPDFIMDDHLILTTLWTNFQNCHPNDRQRLYKNIADYYYIKGTSVDKMIELFNLSWAQIKEANREIVVTHFPPFQESISSQYAGDFLNPYFVNDMQKMFEEAKLQTKLWLCGHTHAKHSYYMGDTLVACNPCGYRGENYKSFDEYHPMILYKEGDLWIQE